MQEEATSGNAAKELSVDAAEFRLPGEGSAAPAAPAAAGARADAGAAASVSTAQAPKGRPAHPNGIATENGVDDRAGSAAASENGLKSSAESAGSEGGKERRESEGASARKSARGGAVAKMIQSLEGGLKGKPALSNGLPNGISPGKEDLHLGKDPVVVHANGK